jgi:hypothetical protein
MALNGSTPAYPPKSTGGHETDRRHRRFDRSPSRVTGIVQLREAIGLADAGAESSQETRTRLVLTAAGLRPQRTQIDVFNRFGDHVGRIDMGWDCWKVGVPICRQQVHVRC